MRCITMPKIFQVFLLFCISFLSFSGLAWSVPEVDNFDGRSIGDRVWWDSDMNVYTRNLAYSADTYQGQYSMEVSYNKNGKAWSFFGFDAGVLHDYHAYDRLGFWVKKITGDDIDILVKFTDAEGDEAEAGNVTVSGTGWQFVHVGVSTLGANTNFDITKFRRVMFFVAPGNLSATGSFLMDEIQFYSSTIAAPVLNTDTGMNNGSYVLSYPAVAGTEVYEIWEDTNNQFTNASANRNKVWQAHFPTGTSLNNTKTSDNTFYYKVRAWNDRPENGGACSAWSAPMTVEVKYVPSGLYLYSLDSFGSNPEYQVSYQGSGNYNLYQILEKRAANDFVVPTGGMYSDTNSVTINKTGYPIVPYYYQVREFTGTLESPGSNMASSNMMAVYRNSSPDLDNFDSRSMGARVWWDSDSNVYTRDVVYSDRAMGYFSMRVTFDKSASADLYPYFAYDIESNISDGLGCDISRYDTFTFMAKKINGSADVNLLVKFVDTEMDESDIGSVNISSTEWQKVTVDLSGKDGIGFCDFNKLKRVMFFAAPGLEIASGDFAMDELRFYKSSLSAPVISSVVTDDAGVSRISWNSVTDAALYELWHDEYDVFHNASRLSAYEWGFAYTDQTFTDASYDGPQRHIKVRSWTDNPANGGVCSEWSEVAVDEFPYLSVTSPLESEVLTSSPVTVTARANADNIVTINGDVVPVVSGVATKDVDLVAGNNAITVVSSLPNGHKIEKTLNVLYDTVVSDLKILYPVDGTVREESYVLVSGTVSGNVSSLSVNGESVYISDGQWMNDVSLVEGNNLISVIATLIDGTTVEKTITVVHSPVNSTLEVTTLSDGDTVLTSPVVVSGTASDNVTVVVINGSYMSTVVGGQWTIVVPLVSGDNTLEIVASVSGGNPITKTFNVFYDTTYPEVTITSPADGIRVLTSPVTITGTVSDNTDILTVNGEEVTITAGSWTKDVSLVSGDNTITVVASINGGHSTTTTINVEYDTIYPQITIASPADGTTVLSTPVTVTGTVSDNTDILTVNGEAVTITAGSWTRDVSLVAGSNDITVVASITGGHSSTESINVIYDLGPTDLVITSPADGTKVLTSPVTITGTVSSNTDSLTVNGEAVTITNGNWTKDVNLVSGDNAITVIASITGGETTQSILNVFYDTVYPEVAIISPADGTKVLTTPVTVTGTVSDNTDTLTVNGEAVTITNGNWSKDVSLVSGDNTIEVVASITGGHSATTSINVEYDTVYPEVAITSPADGTKVLTSPVTVTGTVSDNTDTLTVNGEAVTITAGSWTKDVSLVSGANTIEVVASITGGHSTTTSINIEYDTIYPEVTITSPADGTKVLTSPVTITGTVSDNTDTLTVNGEAVTITNGTWTKDVSLISGDNQVDVVASIAGGHSTTVSINVFYDTVYPEIAITTPADGDRLVITPVTVTGTVSANTDTVIVNGEAATLTGTTWSKDVELLSGNNSILAEALITDGHSTTKSINVFYDDVYPEINITSLTDGAEVITTPVTVTGTVSANTGSVTVNGESVTITDGAWSKDVNLVAGNNVVTVVAQITDGNSLTKTINVIYNEVTELTIATPTAASSITASTIVVEGDCDPTTDTVLVNGYPAVISGNKYICYEVPLFATGAYDINVKAYTGETVIDEQTVSVNVAEIKDIIAITNNPISGKAPFNTSFSLTTDIAETIALYQWDCNEDDVIDYTTTLDETVSYEYPIEQRYYPRVIVTTSSGLKFSKQAMVYVYPGTNILNTITVSQPQDLCVDADNNLFVLSKADHKIYKYDKGGTLITSFGDYGAEDGGVPAEAGLFNSPNGIALDAQGNIYVADTGNNRIQKLDANGNPDTSFGTGGVVENIHSPYDIAVNEFGDVLVSEQGEDMIKEYTTAGVFVKQWNNGETLMGPAGLLFIDNDIFVVNQGNSTVESFNHLSELQNSIGGYGNLQNQLNEPTSLAYDAVYDKIIVLDTNNQKVKLFNSDFSFSREITDISFIEPVAAAAEYSLEKQMVYVADKGAGKVYKIHVEYDTPTNNPVAVFTRLSQALQNQDAETASAEFSLDSRERYKSMFNAMESSMVTAGASMNDYYLIRKNETNAKYLFVRVDGETEYGYQLSMERDRDWNWKVTGF